MKKLFELFEDSNNNDKKQTRKKQIIKDTIKNAVDKKFSNKKDVFDPDPDLVDSESVK